VPTAPTTVRPAPILLESVQPAKTDSSSAPPIITALCVLLEHSRATETPLPVLAVLWELTASPATTSLVLAAAVPLDSDYKPTERAPLAEMALFLLETALVHPAQVLLLILAVLPVTTLMEIVQDATLDSTGLIADKIVQFVSATLPTLSVDRLIA